MHLRIQKCTTNNLKVLAQISRTTFIDAFAKANDPTDFNSYVDEAFAEDTLLDQLKNSNTTFFLVFKGKELAGYLKLNENTAQTDLKLGEALELERIYILKRFQGQQIGKWALNEVKKLALEKQKEFLWLGVWQKNTKAIRFYENQGFSKFGTHPYFIGNDKQTDWLMRFDLSPNS